MDTSSFAKVDWAAIATALSEGGWARLAAGLGPEAVKTLRFARRPAWHALPEQEGVVRQQGTGSYVPMADCDDGVKEIGDELVAALSSAVEPCGLPPIPKFNEATWTLYPGGTGHITAHRDPPAYGGVIAVFTLYGEAPFRIVCDLRPVEWKTQSGDVVVLRGNGWPAPQFRCPVHAVEAPTDRDRMIMTMRFNTRGAGGGYENSDTPGCFPTGPAGNRGRRPAHRSFPCAGCLPKAGKRAASAVAPRRAAMSAFGENPVAPPCLVMWTSH